MTLNENPSLGLGPGTAAGPERGLGKERKLDWRGNQGLPRDRTADQGRKGSWTGEGTKPGQKRVDETEFEPYSWGGAEDCRGTGTRTRKERKLDWGGNQAWTKGGG